MKVVVGLGNPGKEYAGSRHNVGFEVVDRLASTWRSVRWESRYRALVARTRYAGRDVILLKPATFMNLSGEAVLPASREASAEPADVLVVCDCLDLPVGRIRVRSKGSSGGHHGLDSVIERLGTDGFPRVRIGIGAVVGDGADYVLAAIPPSERDAVDDAVTRAAAAIETWVRRGVDAAMNEFNRAPDATDGPGKA